MSGGNSGGLPERVLVATRNAGKLAELKVLFAPIRVELIDLISAGLPESAEEDSLEAFSSFEENALAKARYFHRLSGLPAMADDSGLVVPALGGAPGVHSKRYSGLDGPARQVERANNEKLRRALADVERREATFRCVAAFVDDDREVWARGEAHGRIIDEPRGTGGFGYDPYFLADELGMTFAEADVPAKERVSHRGRAFRELLQRLHR